MNSKIDNSTIQNIVATAICCQVANLQFAKMTTDDATN